MGNGLKSKIKSQYEKIASSWGQKIWVGDSEFNSKIVKFAELSGNENMLEVGIGTGDLATTLGLKQITGVDISENMITECRKKHPSFHLVCADGEKLPFQDNSFDFVCCRNYLQNFNNPSRAFQEMIRVANPRGSIMVIESAVFENERQIITEALRVVEPHHPLFLSHELIDNLFIANGLNDIVHEVVVLHRKWFSRWCSSKQATDVQREAMYEKWENAPKWYLDKYQFTFFDTIREIESTLTFSFVKGIK